MVDGRKPFPSQVASSWVTTRDSHPVLPQTMQPAANLSGVRDGGSGSHPVLPPRGAGGAGMHPALPPKPKPKPRNTSILSGGDKVAPMTTPIPPSSISTSKPPFSLPPKSEQVLGKNLIEFLILYLIFIRNYLV